MFEFLKSDWKRAVQVADAAVFPLDPASAPTRVMGGVRHPDLPAEAHQLSGYGKGKCLTDLAHLGAQPAPEQVLEGRSLYAGPFFRHYGHFTTESLHRLWAYMLAPDRFDHILILPQVPAGAPVPETADELEDHQKAALRYFGIPFDRIVVVTKPLMVRDLTVPCQASLLGPDTKTHPGYHAFLGEHARRHFSGHRAKIAAPEKIYVSRANFLARGSFAGELYLEKLLTADGFHILRPEDLPLEDQLHLYREAGLLIFSEGSALHTTELLGPMKADILCIQRRRETRPLWEKVMEGRCSRLTQVALATSLPSIVANPRGEIAADNALCLMDADALVKYLRAGGFAKLAGYDSDTFLHYEAADVGRYLVQANIRHAVQFGTLANSLQAFRKALKGHKNPYLAETL